MEDIFIGSATSLHYPSMMHIQDLCFAENWSTVQDFESKCKLGGAIVALIRGRAEEPILQVGEEFVVGFEVFFPPGTWKPNGFSDMAPCSPDQWQQLGFTSLALGKAVCVHPRWQGRGIGEKLLSECFRLAKVKFNADGMLSHIWESSPSAVNLARKKRKIKLMEVAIHENAWLTYSISSSWNCPYCGEPPCQCKAIEGIYDLRD